MTEADGQVGLAAAGRAQKDDVVPLTQKAQGMQIADLGLVEAGLKAKIELLERLDRRQPGEFESHGDAAFAAHGHFRREELIQHLDHANLVVSGPFEQSVDAFQRSPQAQVLERVAHARVRKLGHVVTSS
jgi:hypothetical protein